MWYWSGAIARDVPDLPSEHHNRLDYLTDSPDPLRALVNDSYGAEGPPFSTRPSHPTAQLTHPKSAPRARFDASDQALRLFNSEIGKPTNTMCVKSVPNNCQRSLGLIELNETCRRLTISCASVAKCCERCAADRGTTT